MENRFARAFLLSKTGNSISYRTAAKEIHRIVDELIRPHSNEEGIKTLDAYRYFHDREFIPNSWVVKIDGVPAISCLFNQMLESDPGKFFHPSDWGSVVDWPQYDRLADIVAFVTHFWCYDDAMTVRVFLRRTRKEFPDLYLRVLEKLAESLGG